MIQHGTIAISNKGHLLNDIFLISEDTLENKTLEQHYLCPNKLLETHRTVRSTQFNSKFVIMQIFKYCVLVLFGINFTGHTLKIILLIGRKHSKLYSIALIFAQFTYRDRAQLIWAIVSSFSFLLIAESGVYSDVTLPNLSWYRGVKYDYV